MIKKIYLIIFILVISLNYQCFSMENSTDISTNERTIKEFEYKTENLFDISDKWAFSNDYDVKLATSTVRVYERKPPFQYLIHIAVTKESANKAHLEGWITAPTFIRVLSLYVCPREISLTNGWTGTWTRKIARGEFNELLVKLNRSKM